jgi:hypothetical protein
MLSLVMVAALAIPPEGEPPSMSAPKAAVVGRIFVKYREFRIGDMPSQRAPSFRIVARDGRATYPLLIKADQRATLERLAGTGAPAAVVGSMLDINGRPFILVESIKENPR